MNRVLSAFVVAATVATAVYLAPSPEALAALADELGATTEIVTLRAQVAPKATCREKLGRNCCYQARVTDAPEPVDPAAARALRFDVRPARSVHYLPCNRFENAIGAGCEDRSNRPSEWPEAPWGPSTPCLDALDGGVVDGG